MTEEEKKPKREPHSFSLYLLKEEENYTWEEIQSNNNIFTLSQKKSAELLEANAEDWKQKVKLFLIKPTTEYDNSFQQYLKAESIFSEKSLNKFFNLKIPIYSGILFLKVNNRVFALTFGQGFHYLNSKCYEPDFGLITALNILENKHKPSGHKKINLFKKQKNYYKIFKRKR